MDLSIKLTKVKGELLKEPTQYKRMIGKLLYLTMTWHTHDRPVIVLDNNKAR